MWCVRIQDYVLKADDPNNEWVPDFNQPRLMFTLDMMDWVEDPTFKEVKHAYFTKNEAEEKVHDTFHHFMQEMVDAKRHIASGRMTMSFVNTEDVYRVYADNPKHKIRILFLFDEDATPDVIPDDL